MRNPSAKIENRLINNGYKSIVGLDEVGRGAIAGPIVAAAVVFPVKVQRIYRIKNIRDSKLLSSKKRSNLFNNIISNSKAWSVGIVSNQVIDKIGIAKANILAMEKAIEKLNFYVKPDYLLIDYLELSKTSLPQENITKGDQKVYSISAASIIAKVVRDSILRSLHRKYSKYGFNKHVGYGTRLHYKNLKKFGPCPIHRTSFELRE